MKQDKTVMKRCKPFHELIQINSNWTDYNPLSEKEKEKTIDYFIQYWLYNIQQTTHITVTKVKKA